MKKLFVFVLVLIAIVFSFSSVLANEIDGVDSTFEVETNPELVGSYSATRCNQYACWPEYGTYTAKEVSDFFTSKKVGLGWLYVSPDFYTHPEIIFRAAPGYHWEYYDSIFDGEGYKLVKE